MHRYVQIYPWITPLNVCRKSRRIFHWSVFHSAGYPTLQVIQQCQNRCQNVECPNVHGTSEKINPEHISDRMSDRMPKQHVTHCCNKTLNKTYKHVVVPYIENKIAIILQVRLLIRLNMFVTWICTMVEVQFCFWSHDYHDCCWLNPMITMIIAG